MRFTDYVLAEKPELAKFAESGTISMELGRGHVRRTIFIPLIVRVLAASALPLSAIAQAEQATKRILESLQ